MYQLQNDSEDKRPLYLRLYEQLREQIQSGELAAGSRLPSKRIMAGQLSVSINTVGSAYAQLLSEGYIQSRPKSGYYVCAIEHLQSTHSVHIPEHSWKPEPVDIAVDFHPGRIAEDKFPMRLWMRLLRSAMDDPLILRRMPPQGDWELRRVVSEYLREARNVTCRPEQVVIGAGTDNLIHILSFILDNDCSLTVENPVYNRPHEIFARMGHPVYFAPIDKEGIMPDSFQERDHTLVYTTPSHQYPLGYSMPMSRRAKLLNWCGRGEFRYIIEDDYDSEFRYKARPIPSLQSIDRNDRVIYIGTFSRVIAPSVRVSYMVLPESLLCLYQKRYGAYASAASALEQIVLREFICQGEFERHLNRMRVLYGQKRELLAACLAQFQERVQIIGEPAGTHVTIRVRNGMNEQELISAAAAQSVAVYSISRCFVGQIPRQFAGKVLLGFGALTADEISEGVERLKIAWKIFRA